MSFTAVVIDAEETLAVTSENWMRITRTFTTPVVLCVVRGPVPRVPTVPPSAACTNGTVGYTAGSGSIRCGPTMVFGAGGATETASVEDAAKMGANAAANRAATRKNAEPRMNSRA